MNQVQIFENKGKLMGCSNPHSRGQIWSSEFIPKHAEKEVTDLKAYKAKKSSHMLIYYVEVEQKET